MQSHVTTILDRARNGKILSRDDILFLLGLREEAQTAALFEAARSLRRKYSRDHILLYGFLYVGTHCRNRCNFCFYRKDNPEPARYHKQKSRVLDAAVELAESGVHLIDITMGELPDSFDHESAGFGPLPQLVEEIKQCTGLPVMVSPGVVSAEVLKDLKTAGADWYACYQETHNRELFQKLRPRQDYEKRMALKREAREMGFKIEEGILVGVGETPADIADSIEQMRILDAHQVRAMNFVPQKGTPMAGHPAADTMLELIALAVMRLVFPAKLIPATLDVEGLAGLEKRLAAGANVVTSIVPPRRGLAGVVRSFRDIEDEGGTVAEVKAVLERCGLTMALPPAALPAPPRGVGRAKLL
ncbi:MAG: methylornithine synthase PylB [bacterium]|nr:methylornithine synthase PylB [bacterium]